MSDFDLLPYGAYKDDHQGFRHSLDKLIVDYRLNPGCTFTEFLDFFSSSSSFCFVSERGANGYNSFFDKPPCSAYQWFQSSFWFPHCNVKLGFYYGQSWNGDKSEWKFKDLIRVEFNPNKVFQSALFVSLIGAIKLFCKCGILVEVDYAVDVPCNCNQIITQSRMTKVIYNDSRYYGKRHEHRRLKVYNKKREVHDKEKIDLKNPLTRCEITFRLSGEIDYFSCFLSSGFSEVKLSNNLQSIADLISLLSAYGEDREELLKRFVPDKRNRDMLQPALFGECHVVFDFVRFYQLLVFYSDLYNFGYYFTGPLGQSYNLGCNAKCISLD